MRQTPPPVPADAGRREPGGAGPAGHESSPPAAWHRPSLAEIPYKRLPSR